MKKNEGLIKKEWIVFIFKKKKNYFERGYLG